jgi:hypothetical protein
MSDLVKYAKSKGMNLEQFRELEAELGQTADKILENIKTCGKYAIDSGMYYPTGEILDDGELAPYITWMLKQRGVEFRENGTLWRL